MSKKTLVIGASTTTSRYSNMAMHKLVQHQHPVEAIGAKEGAVDGIQIHADKPAFENIDTVTMYIGPARQPEYYDYILSLKPKRIVFNPGTENDELYKLANNNGIQTVEACTLVMLSIGNY